MTLPFKPHLIALVCSAGLFAASGVLYVKSRAPEAPAQAATPAPEQTQTAVPAPVAKTTFTTAQIDQWVAPVALYPDALLSQVLMASTYPANVVQAVQWSRDNPTLQGDAAIQAVASQPWDPSVKSLVAFPQLMAVLIHEKYEKTGRTLDYSGFDGIRFGGACKPVEQILVVKP